MQSSTSETAMKVYPQRKVVPKKSHFQGGVACDLPSPVRCDCCGIELPWLYKNFEETHDMDGPIFLGRYHVCIGCRSIGKTWTKKQIRLHHDTETLTKAKVDDKILDIVIWSALIFMYIVLPIGIIIEALLAGP